MPEARGYIHSVESFGTVDGPGIRYVIFFSGCPMHCLYCHNPDAAWTDPGRLMSVKELLSGYEGVRELIGDGGITATGGEPLLQLDFLLALFEEAERRGIHTCLDTCGICFDKTDPKLLEKYDELMKHTDLVMLDIKHADDAEHRRLTGCSNKRVFEFLAYLAERNKDTLIRHVVVHEYTYREDFLRELGRKIGVFKNIRALEVLPYHDMAKPKYESLGLEYPLADIKPTTVAEAKRAKELIKEGMKESRTGMIKKECQK